MVVAWEGNEKKLAHLLSLEGARERLRLVKADLMEEGSFDDAIMGCHGVFHTASPVLKPSSDPKACSHLTLYIYILSSLHVNYSKIRKAVDCCSIT